MIILEEKQSWSQSKIEMGRPDFLTDIIQFKF